MANPVHVVELGIDLDFEQPDLGHPSIPGLWDILYAQGHGVRVEDRGLQCAGICRDVGVVAWMHLRQRTNGRREAVHQHAEDEARHQAPERPEHRAYKDRIVRVARDDGHTADTEVRAPGGRIITDALVEGVNGLRIGWEIQLSTADADGPRSVRERARKAIARGITPAWHTDRRDYAQRNDTAWTRSDQLPAQVIAKTGDLRVVSGFRLLDFWKCDITAFRECPTAGWGRRCGKTHATPKPRDVLFDDLVRKTAAGLIVPFEYRNGSRTHRFWVPSEDRERYLDATGTPEPNGEGQRIEPGASTAGPTCRPRKGPGTGLDASGQPIPPCHFCGDPASLMGQEGKPEHRECRIRSGGSSP